MFLIHSSKKLFLCDCKFVVSAVTHRQLCDSRKNSTSGEHEDSSPSNQQQQAFIKVFEIDRHGNFSQVAKTLADVTKLKQETNLPLRDMRMFFQSRSVQDRLPLILSRPSSRCFLVSLEHIKLLCMEDTCMVLHPEDSAIKSFVADLKQQLAKRTFSLASSPKDASLHAFLDAVADRSEIKLELAVLETTLSSVTSKFKRHLALMKPVLDLLLQETSSNPSAAMLRRMLAFRKSLNTFEMRVTTVRSAVSDILRSPVDLAGLCLSKPQESEVEEMELLLEAYNSDLKELECELSKIKEQIEDTNDFINIHLNSIRNSFIEYSLKLEILTCSISGGALCCGIFGMNLISGLEQNPTAFVVTTTGIVVAVGTLIGIFANRYSSLNKDYSSVRSFQSLKRFFNYVKDVEDALHVNDRHAIDKAEFRKILEPVVGSQLTEHDVDKLFRLLDDNSDGFVERQELTEQRDSGVSNNNIANSKRAR